MNFISNLIINYKNFFDSYELLNDVNGYTLDNNQRKSIIFEKKNNLVIAGAGSGKTLTILGKIKYLILHKNVEEKEILCISFTNNTVNDLKETLNKNGFNIDVLTFHKLAIKILKKSNINFNILNFDYLKYIIEEYIYYLLYPNIIDFNLLEKTIITFISLFKSNNYKIDYLNKIIDKCKDKKEKIMLELIKDIYIIYLEELKAYGLLDFDDLINNACEYALSLSLPYKYIIIDEYQDTSKTKYLLLKNIQRKNNCKLFAVGDDFQSIYRFTGCNLDIFVNFKKYFKNAKITKINKTYRNSQELIDIAGSFIMKNKKQIKKRMVSEKRLNKPIIIVYYENLSNCFERIINKINTNILVLGRNNNDINGLIGEKFKLENEKLIYKNNKTKNITYLSVHKSKGLQEENVIVLNNLNLFTGFPCKIVNNKIIDYVLDSKDLYPYEEERRLFYVALTRTKNYVYLFTKKNKESIFIRELIKKYKRNIQIIK